MAKVKIKTILKNKTENEVVNGEFLGIKLDNKIKYIDNNVKTIISIISDGLIIDRIDSSYSLTLNLSKNKKTVLNYCVNDLSPLILDVETNKLSINEKEIEVEYNLIIDSSFKLEFSFYLQMEEIL